MSIEPIVFQWLGFDSFITITLSFHFASFLLYLSTIIVFFFRVDFHEDWMVDSESKALNCMSPFFP